jgi:hypothetical protein
MGGCARNDHLDHLQFPARQRASSPSPARRAPLDHLRQPPLPRTPVCPKSLSPPTQTPQVPRASSPPHISMRLLILLTPRLARNPNPKARSRAQPRRWSSNEGVEPSARCSTGTAQREPGLCLVARHVFEDAVVPSTKQPRSPSSTGLLGSEREGRFWRIRLPGHKRRRKSGFGVGP